MGLDSAELVMEIEEAFDIRIPDEVAEKMVTVGDVYRYVLEHTPGDTNRRPSVCLTAVTFYKLRRLFMADLGIDRRRLRTDTSIESLLPPLDRRETWSRLAKALELKLPELTLPPRVERLIQVVPALVAVLLLIAMLGAFPPMVSFMAVGVLFVLLVFAVANIAQPWATRPSPAFATLGGLARVVMADNLGTIRAQHAGPNPADTWEVLQAVIVQQLGVDPKDVTPEASFVYDLGLS
jgi:acyl carrier protein